MCQTSREQQSSVVLGHGAGGQGKAVSLTGRRLGRERGGGSQDEGSVPGSGAVISTPAHFVSPPPQSVNQKPGHHLASATFFVLHV